MENYEILVTVGEGSYGVVMKCRHRYSQKIVAIKKLTDFGDENYVKKMILREVRILKKLRHENLVQLFDVFKKKRRFYLVFEYLEKTVLDELEKNPKGLGERKTLEYLYQTIRAIEFCHSKNVIHRDVKPENLLVSITGILKLCDFGCARVISDSFDGVYTEYVATRWYRAPELLVRDREYGKPVDIWASGCVFAEMLTGDPLFPGQSDVDQLYVIIKCFGKLCPKHQQILNSSHFHDDDIKFDKDITESGNAMNNFHALHNMFQSWSSSNLNMVTLCLHLDPDKRPTASELLKMECFKENNLDESWFASLLQNNRETKLKSHTSNELPFKSNSIFNSNQSTVHRIKKSSPDDCFNSKIKSLEEKYPSPNFLTQINSNKSSTFKETPHQVSINLPSPRNESISICTAFNEKYFSTLLPQKPKLNLDQSLLPLASSIKNNHKKQDHTIKKYKFKNEKFGNYIHKMNEQNALQDGSNFKSTGNLNLPVLKNDRR